MAISPLSAVRTAVTTPPAPDPTTSPADGSASTPVHDASSNTDFLNQTAHALGLSFMAAQDVGTFVGIGTTPGNLGPKPALAGALLVNAAVAGGLAIKKGWGTELNMKPKQLASAFVSQAETNFGFLTPTLVSAVAGPAIADGVTMIAPNLVPKYKAEMTESQKSRVKIGRAVAGGAIVGLAGAVAFLVKPDLFKSVGFISQEARAGTITGQGFHGFFSGVFAGGRAGGEITRQLAPMAKDAVFSNRMLMGIAGAGAAVVLLNHAVGQTDTSSRNKWLGATAGAAALATVGIIAAPRLTRGAESAAKLAFMPSGGMFQKPNIQWMKEFAFKVAPVTGGIAGGAASQYFNIVSDFQTITQPYSPYRQ